MCLSVEIKKGLQEDQIGERERKEVVRAQDVKEGEVIKRCRSKELDT